MEDCSFYLIGDPVEHSISPFIHNAAFKNQNLPYKYKKLQVPIRNLPDVLRTFTESKTLGFNVTIPLKTIIFNHLDEISSIGKYIGAINTVKIENGRFLGTNTDLEGIHLAITKSGFKPEEYNEILMIGAGGAARAVAYHFSQYDIKIRIVNRTISTSQKLLHDIKNLPSTIAQIEVPSQNDASSYHNADLIINTTPVGMWPNIHEDPLSGYTPHSNQWVFDLVYNPIETSLIKKSKENGCEIITGLDMLIYQAASAFKYWTGIYPDVKIMQKAAIEALNLISSK